MKKEIEKEIKKISPKFPIRKQVRKEALPEGYFEKLHNRVMLGIQEEKDNIPTRKAKIVTMRRFIRSIAAVLFVGVCTWLVVQLYQHSESQVSILADLSQEDALAFALEYPDEMGSLLQEMGESFEFPALFTPSDIDTHDPDIYNALIEEIADEDIEELL